MDQARTNLRICGSHLSRLHCSSVRQTVADYSSKQSSIIFRVRYQNQSNEPNHSLEGRVKDLQKKRMAKRRFSKSTKKAYAIGTSITERLKKMSPRTSSAPAKSYVHKFQSADLWQKYVTTFHHRLVYYFYVRFFCLCQ